MGGRCVRTVGDHCRVPRPTVCLERVAIGAAEESHRESHSGKLVAYAFAAYRDEQLISEHRGIGRLARTWVRARAIRAAVEVRPFPSIDSTGDRDALGISVDFSDDVIAARAERQLRPKTLEDSRG